MRVSKSVLAVMATLMAGAVALPAYAGQSYYFRSKAVPIADPAPSLSLPTATLPAAKVGKSWSYDFAGLAKTANIPAGSVAWTGKNLPAWMTLAASTGTASGTPTAEGTPSFEITATAAALSEKQTFTVVIGAATFEASQVAMGSNHSCALMDGGAVRCWGLNSSGQLGTGSTTSLSRPGSAAIASGAKAVAAGSNFTCALLDQGEVKCWGGNNEGQLGVGGTSIRQERPGVSVFGKGSGVEKIALGGNHGCALLSGGAVKCWGYNSDGQLGLGDKVQRNSVTTATIPSGASSIAAYGYQSCALVSGKVLCWGDNSQSQIGNNSTTDVASPVEIAVARDATGLALGYWHTCALLSGGGVQCWGRGHDGQLGIGGTATAATPGALAIASGVDELVSGNHHVCARSGGAMTCWGYNVEGQLGTGGTAKSSPGAPTMASGVVGMTGGDGATCASLVGGSINCWGNNANGQLGTGNTTSKSVPGTTTVLPPL